MSETSETSPKKIQETILWPVLVTHTRHPHARHSRAEGEKDLEKFLVLGKQRQKKEIGKKKGRKGTRETGSVRSYRKSCRCLGIIDKPGIILEV